MTDRREIALGQRVYCILHGGREGTVVSITGQQSPQSVRRIGGIGTMGGSAAFDIVWDGGARSNAIPESVMRGVQWDILDEVVSAEAVEAAKASAAAHEAEAAIEGARQRANFEAAVQALRADPELAHLEQGDDRHSGKLAAANLRKELRRQFPGVKFSVRKSDYGTIRVDWTDGPTHRQVREITDRHVSASFDGMQDLESPVRTPFNCVFGGAKYIFPQRSYSAELTERAIDAVFKTYAANLDGIARPSAEESVGGALRSVAVPGLGHETLGDLIVTARGQIDATPPARPARPGRVARRSGPKAEGPSL
ncbi:hypothetical protein J2T57_001567 [Natronocella acetinitrilica]|uniref:Large polyvalent protein associated domain-containing protein n=1 Tax=Natronocella acetinitrilica TaxID=414046 RepID=A0AAE3KAL1_9GAMM|nr:LPD29 domain-containing protein [Natronocella acetinitrilica]MCP1674465.1 hypothetical protein [Natronocella acetinitrilica]